MSGPTTAGELLYLAEQQLHELTAKVGTDRAPRPAQLAAAWPAFRRAGGQLIAALHPDIYGHATPTPDQRSAAAAGIPPVASAEPADPHLARAAELLSVAADLLASRDRRGLPAADRRADLSRAARPLLAGAYLVTQATGTDSGLLEAAMNASSAARIWSAAAQPTITVDPRIGSLHDASTLPSQAVSTVDGLPGRLNAAVARWQQSCLAAAERAAPSSADLHGTALAAGRLLALAQALLRVRDTPDGPYHSEPARTVAHLQAAGRSWNAAAAGWGALRTGTPASAELVAATTSLRQAVDLIARTGEHWAIPHDIRGRADPAAALAAARGALIAVQGVAEQHSPLVAELARTGGLYVPARQLSPSLENLPARLARQWLPATATEHGPLTAAYAQLPASTAAARLAYTALTSPAGSGPRPAEQQPPGPPGQALRGNPAPPVSLPDLGAQTLATRRWQQAVRELDPRLLSDPHWLVLAGALDRVDLAGVDVHAALASTTAQGPLPEQHPARTLHYRLIEVCDAAIIPHTDQPPPPRPPTRTATTTTTVPVTRRPATPRR